MAKLVCHVTMDAPAALSQAPIATPALSFSSFTTMRLTPALPVTLNAPPARELPITVPKATLLFRTMLELARSKQPIQTFSVTPTASGAPALQLQPPASKPRKGTTLTPMEK